MDKNKANEKMVFIFKNSDCIHHKYKNPLFALNYLIFLFKLWKKSIQLFH